MSGRSFRSYRKRFAKRSRFGAELAALASGAPMREVLRSAFGESYLGHRWVERVMTAITAAFETQKPRRKCVELLLRLLDAMRLHGRSWRVVDAGGFVGHQHEWGHPVDADGVIDTETWKRIGSVAKEHAGGLSARMDRCPRQLHRYRRVLRAGRVIGSQRTHRKMKDAEFPRVLPYPDAQWGYAQIWLAADLSPELEKRLRGTPAPRYHKRTQPRYTCPTSARPKPPPPLEWNGDPNEVPF